MTTVTAIFHSKNSCSRRNKEAFENNSFYHRSSQLFETIDQSNTFQDMLENRLSAMNKSIVTATHTNVASILPARYADSILSQMKTNGSIPSILPADDNNREATYNGNQI